VSDYNLFWFPDSKSDPGRLEDGNHPGHGRYRQRVVTAAGLVFVFTMASMAVSDLRILDQIGTTIGLGLLFDTAGCAVVHDAGHRHAARSVVLVAVNVRMRPASALVKHWDASPPGGKMDIREQTTTLKPRKQAENPT
jgi:hypothetical protein